MYETMRNDGEGAEGGVLVDGRHVARAGAVTLLAAIALGVDGRVSVIVAGVGAAVLAWTPRGRKLSLRALLGF